MADVSTHIAINAPPALVWAVLMDFAYYKKWNPFIVHVSGLTSPGSRLRVGLRFATSSRVTEISPLVQISGQYDFCWKGKTFIPGLFDGEHHFRVEKSETGSVFHHYEHFSGIGPLVMGKKFFARVKQRFTVMNQALKTRVETMAAAAELGKNLYKQEPRAAAAGAAVGHDDAVPV